MNRILGIDYGEKRIGLALSDPLKIIAQPYEVWENTTKKEIFKKLDELINLKTIEKIVIGLPKNMDGSIGFQAKEVKAFFEDYQNEKIKKIIYWDERLSSKEAEKILYEKNLNSQKQRAIKDAYAASVILKEYLEYGE